MHVAGHVRIIVIKPVNQRAVHHHRIPHLQARRHADHLGVARRQRRQPAVNRARKIVTGSRQRNADAIQNKILDAFPAGRRNGVKRGL